MVKCNNCGKEVEWTTNDLCYECFMRAEEVNASLIYPLKIVSLKINLLNNESLDQQDIVDMIKYARHIHVAGEGNNIDTCRKCGHDFRHIIHFRYGEN